MLPQRADFRIYTCRLHLNPTPLGVVKKAARNLQTSRRDLSDQGKEVLVQMEDLKKSQQVKAIKRSRRAAVAGASKPGAGGAGVVSGLREPVAETSQEPQYSRASGGAETAAPTVPRGPCPLHSLSCNRGWKEGRCTGVKDMTSKEPELQEAHQA